MSNTAKVCELLDMLCDQLINPPDYFELEGRNYKYVVSEYNGFESYVFLYNPNTVTSVVFDIDNDEFFEKIYYTLDEGQHENYRALNEIVFTTNEKNINTKVFKKTIIEDEKTCIYNTFPLIHFHKRSICRPPGLGIFLYQKKYLGVLLWHNMSGDDNDSYTYMYHLANSVIVNNLTFDISDGKNDITIKNLIVMGDFNVDEIDSKENDLDPYALFVKNKMIKTVSDQNALSLLNYYHHDWDYGRDMDILTRAFDNIFYRCPEFEFKFGGVENLIDFFLDEKDYLLRFFDQSQYISGKRDYIPDFENWTSVKKHPYGSYVHTKMSSIKKDKKCIFSVEERKEVTIEFMQECRFFRSGKRPRLEQSRKILDIRFDKFYAEAFGIYISPIEFIGTRYSKLKFNEEEELLNGDIIFYLREFVSDHLPVSITFK